MIDQMNQGKCIPKMTYEFAYKHEVWIALVLQIHITEIVGYYLNTYKDLS
jgi:hypothetical protein